MPPAMPRARVLRPGRRPQVRRTRSPLTSFAAQVAVRGSGVHPERAEPGRYLLGHRHAAVLAAGAADRDGHEPLALPLVALADGLDHRDVPLQERLGVRTAGDVL